MAAHILKPGVQSVMTGNPRISSSTAGPLTTALSRRRFLQTLTAAGAAAAGTGAVMAFSGGPTHHDPLAVGGSGRGGAAVGDVTQPLEGAAGRRIPGAVDDRVLVIVDLQGGNDGLSTLIPAGDPRYYDLRPNVAVPDDEVLRLDDHVGLHPSLGRLHRRGITTVEGVGPIEGDLSHFAMTERWERGDVSGTHGLRTGFLGRLADAVNDGSPLVGVSLLGPTPHLITDRAATMALRSPDELWYLEPSDWNQVQAYQQGLSTFVGAATDNRLSVMIGQSYDDLMALAVDLATDDDSELDWDHPMVQDGGQLGQNLYFAADLIAADVGLRVVYVADGDYDTHQNHQWRQADNLQRVDASIDGFLTRAEELGVADRVLVATISEFGRRVAENDGGLDHGSASTMLVAGPVEDRRLGERPALDDLDDDGNLRVTMGFDRYLAGLAEGWLGVEAASILPGEPEPLDVV